MNQRGESFNFSRLSARLLSFAQSAVTGVFAAVLICLALVDPSHAASFTQSAWGRKQVQPRANWVRQKAATQSFVGRWKNVDSATRGITRLEIVQNGRNYSVHAWGKCQPRDCDLGTASAVAYGASVSDAKPSTLSAVFKQSTGDTLLILHLEGGQLAAEALRQFSSSRAAGRSNYTASYRFASDGGAAERSSSNSAANSGNPPASSSSAASPPAQGRFRVTITGFTVDQETRDDALQRDGKGDEVYLYTDVAVLNPQGRMIDQKKLRTVTMGDVNGWPDRLRAGTRSPKGGLETGDQYPGTNPWQYSGRTYSDRLPELIWQGALAQGGNRVVITPTIWEWDKSGGLWNMVGSFAGLIPDALTFMASSVGNFIFQSGAATPREDCIGYPNLDTANTFGWAETRPIGMKKYDGYRFCPVMITLDYDKAKKAIETSQGFGNGVVPLRFKDDMGLGSGEYTLYLKVETY